MLIMLKFALLTMLSLLVVTNERWQSTILKYGKFKIFCYLIIYAGILSRI